MAIHQYVLKLVYELGAVNMARTNIEIDEQLLSDGLKLTQLKTKKELVNYALEELVKRLKRRKILGLEGKIVWNGNLETSRLGRP
jgi:Arc/MetJ family transcription regulator